MILMNISSGTRSILRLECRVGIPLLVLDEGWTVVEGDMLSPAQGPHLTRASCKTGIK